MVDNSPEVAAAFPELSEGISADYSDEDEPVLRWGQMGLEWTPGRDNYPYQRRMSRGEYDRTKRVRGSGRGR
jgi:hypothetical protein